MTSQKFVQQARKLLTSVGGSKEAFRSFFALLLCSLCFTGLAFGNDSPDTLVYGPETFKRGTGAPNEWLVDIPAPAGLAPPYELRITNGDAFGSFRVTSARVFFNDVELAGPNHFGKRTASIKRNVELRSTNRLRVSMAGAPGSRFSIQIQGSRPRSQPVVAKPDPLKLAPGATGLLQVELSPVPTEAGALHLTSSNERAKVPATISYAAGQTMVDVPITAANLGEAVIKISSNGAVISATAIVTDAPPTVLAIEPGTAELQQNTVSVFNVAISPVQATPVTVNLQSSNPQIASAPVSVRVPAGAHGASYGLTGHSPGNTEVSASLNGSAVVAAVTVRSQSESLLSLTPLAVAASPGADIRMAVQLATARAAPTELSIDTSTSGILELPSTVAVPQGALAGDFIAAAKEPGTVMVDAAVEQSGVSALVQVSEAALALAPVALEMISLEAGATARVGVRLNLVQATNTNIDVAAGNPALLSVPEALIVPAGIARADLQVTAGTLGGDTQLSLTLGESIVTIPVRVLEASPALQPPTRHLPFAIEEGAVARLPLFLAGSGKDDRIINISLLEGNAVQVPESLTIAAGERSIELPVAGLRRGLSVIRATLDGVVIDVPVEVVGGLPRVASILADTTRIAKGNLAQLTVQLTHAARESTRVDLSQSGAGRFLFPSYVTVPAGASEIDVPIAAASVGGVNLVAQANGGSAALSLQAIDPVVVGLRLSPAAPIAYVGETERFTATASWSDGTRTDVTDTVVWSSSEPSVVDMTNAGVATALEPGLATITAQIGEVSIDTPMTARALPELSITPAQVRLAVGETVQLAVGSPLAAGIGGLEVTLQQTGDGSVNVPAVVLIPEGAETGGFEITGVREGELMFHASAPGRGPASASITVTSAEQGIAVASVSPLAGPEGTRVTLTGHGFDPEASGNQVRFGGDIQALVVESSSSHMIVVVPPGAQTGAIKVTAERGSANSPVFTVERPFDIGFSASPASISLIPGSRVFVAVEMTSTGSQAFEGLAALSVSGLPAGVTATFEPRQLVAGRPGTMILAASKDVPPIETNVGVRATVQAAGTTLTRSSLVGLRVTQSEGASLSGRFVTPEGEGIAGVVVRAELDGETITQTLSDAAGSFALEGLPGAQLTLKMDATRAHPLYPIWPHRLTLSENQTLSLPEWTISPPPAEEHFTAIDNSTKDQVVEDERFPGLSVTLPAGVKILGWDGIAKTRIALERKAPESLPTEPPPVPVREVFHLNFGTPMGGLATQPIPVSIPNVTGKEPGEKTEIWYYDGSPMTNSGEWKVAGPATISPDGMSVVSDPGYGLPSFCGVCGLFAARCDPPETGPPPAPPPPPDDPDEPEDCNKGGNPVELITGYEMPRFGGLRCGGHTAREMRLSYNPFDAFQGRAGVEGAVGRGWVLDYDIVLADSNQVIESKRLLLPPNERINFALQADGSYQAKGDPRFDGASLTRWGTQGWELIFRDGTRWRFGMTDSIGMTASFLIEIQEPGGRVTKVDRRADRKITRIGDAHRDYKMTYGSNNLVSSISDSGGRDLRFTYNADRRIETITEADGGITRYEYVGDNEHPALAACPQASDGKRIKRIHYPGAAVPTENQHGSSRRVLLQKASTGLLTHFEYELVGACVTHVDNPNERCTGSSCPAVDSWENFLAGWRIVGGQVVSSTVVDSDGGRVTRRYDGRRMISEIRRADGQAVTRRRNDNGRIISSTDALGRATRYSYDAKGNLIRTVDALGRVTVLEYDGKWGKPVQITRALEDGTLVRHRFQYDNGTGSLTAYQDPLGLKTTYHYNTSGQLAAITDPLAHTTLFDYNQAGDLLKVTDALGNVRETASNAVGRTVSVIDEVGFESTFNYSKVDQLQSWVDPTGGETRQIYDAARRLTSVVNARGHAIRSYQYDQYGRLSSILDAFGQADRFEYDGRNLVVRKRDRLNRVTDYGYDEQKRLASVAHSDGETTNVVRDALGRIISVEDNASRIDYTYDAADRLIKERTTNRAGTHEVTYQWDALDRLTKRALNGRDATLYFYDLAGRLSGVEYRDTLTTYTWDDAGRLVSKKLANGIVQSLSWDNANRVTRIEYRASDASLIEALDYQYDAKGQRILKAAGQSSVPETPMEAEYDVADRMTHLTLFPSTAAEATYLMQYDIEGRLIRRANSLDATDTTAYEWDSRGRLVGITGPTVDARFRYDALGRRIERTINGRTLRAIYDGMQMIGEVAGGVVDSTYLTGLQVDEMLTRHTAAGARTYLTDALGSVIAQTDGDQKPISWYNYSPYGEVVVVGDDEHSPVQYTGRENDGTGLYYYRARYYDPILKRFVSEDPIGLAGGVNVFAYTAGNPLLYVDADGLKGAPPQSLHTPMPRIQQGPRYQDLHQAFDNMGDPLPPPDQREPGANCGVFTCVWVPFPERPKPPLICRVHCVQPNMCEPLSKEAVPMFGVAGCYEICTEGPAFR